MPGDFFSVLQEDVLEALRTFRTNHVSVRDALDRLMEAYRPIDQGAWVGVGADAFKAEFMGELVPVFQQLIELVGQVHVNVNDAFETSLEGDEQCAQIANDIVQQIEGIY